MSGLIKKFRRRNGPGPKPRRNSERELPRDLSVEYSGPPLNTTRRKKRPSRASFSGHEVKQRTEQTPASLRKSTSNPPRYKRGLMQPPVHPPPAMLSMSMDHVCAARTSSPPFLPLPDLQDSASSLVGSPPRLVGSPPRLVGSPRRPGSPGLYSPARPPRHRLWSDSRSNATEATFQRVPIALPGPVLCGALYGGSIILGCTAGLFFIADDEQTPCLLGLSGCKVTKVEVASVSDTAIVIIALANAAVHVATAGAGTCSRGVRLDFSTVEHSDGASSFVLGSPLQGNLQLCAFKKKRATTFTWDSNLGKFLLVAPLDVMRLRAAIFVTDACTGHITELCCVCTPFNNSYEILTISLKSKRVRPLFSLPLRQRKCVPSLVPCGRTVALVSCGDNAECFDVVSNTRLYSFEWSEQVQQVGSPGDHIFIGFSSSQIEVRRRQHVLLRVQRSISPLAWFPLSFRPVPTVGSLESSGSGFTLGSQICDFFAMEAKCLVRASVKLSPDIGDGGASDQESMSDSSDAHVRRTSVIYRSVPNFTLSSTGGSLSGAYSASSDEAHSEEQDDFDSTGLDDLQIMKETSHTTTTSGSATCTATFVFQSRTETNDPSALTEAETVLRDVGVDRFGVLEYLRAHPLAADEGDRGGDDGVLLTPEQRDALRTLRAYASGSGRERDEVSVEVNPELLMIKWDEIVEIKNIGKGSYGDVQLVDYKNGTEAAVKVLSRRKGRVRSMLPELVREASVMSRARHKNVVVYMGLVVGQYKLAIMTEYMPGGNLQKLIASRDRYKALSLAMKVEVLLDIAQGINFLHNVVGICHRDIKPSNVLLSGMDVSRMFPVKICDFGLAGNEELGTNTETAKGRFSPCWAAPETWINMNNEMSDVYSYGVLTYELLTRKNPFASVASRGITFRRVGPVPVRVIQHSAAYFELNEIVERCCEHRPFVRPTIGEVNADLKQLLALLLDTS